MADRLSYKYIIAGLLFVAGLGLAMPAHAGFQWVAPGGPISAPLMPQPQAVAPSVASSVAASASPDIISPVVITGYSAQTVSAPVMTPMAAPVAPASTLGDNSVVVGFAKSVPLAVALRQILPTGYAFSIDQNVDMGTLVSFQGGRPWRDTLRDALAPVGLIMAEQGQMVTVGYPRTSAPAIVSSGIQPAMIESSYRDGMEPKNIISPSPSPLISSDIQLSQLPSKAPSFPDMQMASALAGPTPAEAWTAERGDHLRKVLEGWARRANVEFDWLSEYDYPLEASVSFSGNFEDAVRDLLIGFQGAHPQPVAELHSNKNLGQMVLVVQTRGNTNSD